MKYAVISINDNQYKVTEDTELLVDKIDKKDLKSEVLLLVDGDEVSIGDPILKNASVELEYINDEKGKKLHVRKFRSKSKYRKKIGFRPEYSRIKVGKIINS